MDHPSVFIDGTKLENRAGRYTFVWRKNEEKHLGREKEQVPGSTGCTSAELFSDRNDVKTLQPFLKQMEQQHQDRYKEVVADAGYESLDPCLCLDSTGQICFIKPTNYDQSCSKKFRKQIGRIENMKYSTEEDCFIRAQGRRFSLRRESTEFRNGQLVSTAWYCCDSCDGCPCRFQCCRAKDPAKLWEIMRKKTFWEKRAMATENMTALRGSIPGYAALSRRKAPLYC